MRRHGDRYAASRGVMGEHAQVACAEAIMDRQPRGHVYMERNPMHMLHRIRRSLGLRLFDDLHLRTVGTFHEADVTAVVRWQFFQDAHTVFP
jgi:hypothetical protein